MKSGIYRLESVDENNLPIITTTFYLDGDTSTELYCVNEDSTVLLVESNEEKLTEHLKTVEKKVGTMDVFYTQIQVIIGVIGTLITYFTAQMRFDDPLTSAGITIGLGTFFILIRKYILKAIIWTVKNIVIPLIQKNFF
jgi:hypothetical protein